MCVKSNDGVTATECHNLTLFRINAFYVVFTIVDYIYCQNIGR
jgi:hypothetical protein